MLLANINIVKKKKKVQRENWCYILQIICITVCLRATTDKLEHLK